MSWGMKARIGDRGQRYEVRFIGSNDKEYVAGWTDNKDGKPFVQSINKHPVWHSPKVIDREKFNQPIQPTKKGGG